MCCILCIGPQPLFHAFFSVLLHQTFRRRQLGVVERSAAGRMLNNVIEPIERLITCACETPYDGHGAATGFPSPHPQRCFLLGLHVFEQWGFPWPIPNPSLPIPDPLLAWSCIHLQDSEFLLVLNGKSQIPAWSWELQLQLHISPACSLLDESK